MSDSPKKRAGRPPGRQHDAELRVRIPGPSLQALKEISRRIDLSVSELVRMAISRGVVEKMPGFLETWKDSSLKARKRFRAYEMLKLMQIFITFNGPTGLDVARRKEAGELEDFELSYGVMSKKQIKV